MNSVTSGRVWCCCLDSCQAPAILPTITLPHHCECPCGGKGLNVIPKHLDLAHTSKGSGTTKCLWSIFENLHPEEGVLGARSSGEGEEEGSEHTSRPCAPEPVIQLRGALTSWCKRFREETGGCRGGQRPARKSWLEAGRINYEAGKCLALPGFIQTVGGVSPWLEATGLHCVLVDLFTTTLFPPAGIASGGQDPYPPRAWPKAAAWSIFSEWIKINTTWFIIKRGETRVPGLDIKE